MNPVEALKAAQSRAFSAKDPNAGICYLALSNDGTPSVRTLIIRSIEETGLTLFINKTSAKWQAICNNKKAEILLWYPSVQIQFRVSGRISELDRAFVEQNWPNKPEGSKLLDYAYASLGPQGTPVSSRSLLEAEIERLRASHEGETLTTPETAAAILLAPSTIEMLALNNETNLHDRRLFTLDSNEWSEEILIP